VGTLAIEIAFQAAGLLTATAIQAVAPQATLEPIIFTVSADKEGGGGF
jgi:hypothetical protein